MTLTYDDEVHLDKGRIEGDDITAAVVFSWLRDEGDKSFKRVRVQARQPVWDSWGIKWNGDEAIKRAFRERRASLITAAAKAADTGGDFRVFDVPPDE